MNTRLNLCGMALLVAALVLMVTESSVFAQGPGGQRGGQRGQGQGQGGQRGPGGQQGQGGGRRGQSSPLMRIFDTDGDGAISTAEMNNATAVLKQMDKDGNGSLSAEEVRPQGGRGQGGQRGGKGQRGQGGRQGQRGQGGGQIPAGQEAVPQSRRGGAGGDMQFASQLMELDMNGDGSLVRVELPEHMRVAFDIADADGNGSVNAAERVTLASKFRRNLLNPNGDVMKNVPTHGNR